MFTDRHDAGRRLAAALERFRNTDALVLGIPRGGVAVACEIAEALGLQCDAVVVRKLPYPDNPEAGFGAVAEDGSLVILPGACHHFRTDVMRVIIDRQKEIAAGLVEALRQGRKLTPVEGRTVILVDDGIAMGGTMRAAILLCRKGKAAKIVVAAPVSGPEMPDEMAGVADEVVILEQPRYFEAVAQVYENWYDMSDAEAAELLALHHAHHAGSV
jgi:putative phosphoribosyl transferase